MLPPISSNEFSDNLAFMIGVLLIVLMEALSPINQVATTLSSPAISAYHLEDAEKSLEINQASTHPGFQKVENLDMLNFGITQADQWLRIELAQLEEGSSYMLSINTIGPDTMEVYHWKNGQYIKTLIGEPFRDDHRFPTYIFNSQERKEILFLHVIGAGHPIALPLSVQKASSYYSKENTTILTAGFIYGLIFLIAILSLLLFYGTQERIYLYFFFLNVCSSAVILYYDGFARLYLLGDSPYWHNQFIVIAFGTSYIAVNYYIAEFLKIKKVAPAFHKWFTYLNMLILLMLVVSFWHPYGFRIYVHVNIWVTPLMVVLFVQSLWYVRHNKDYFVIQLIAVCLIVLFGTVGQLYFLGLTPVNTFTVHAVHSMILPQLLVQSYAMGKRFSILSRERADLLRASEQHSQSLITTLENERKRLSGEFHDSIGQNLLVIRNRILMMLKGKLPEGHSDKLNGLAAITSETLEEIRAISQDLRPSTLDSIGLTASLANMMVRLQKSTAIEIHYSCKISLDELVHKDKEINIYRILQELMNNTLKHSKATKATVIIEKRADQLSIMLSDDGVGFDTNQSFVSGTGNGLSGIKERIKILNGGISFDSGSQKGVDIKINIPLDR